MERKKYILIVLFMLLVCSLTGQKKAIYKAYISGDMTEWKSIMEANRAQTNEQKLELINYHYGYIAYCIDMDKNDEAKGYMQKAEKLIAELEKKQYKLSMLNAYKSAFVGYKIGLAPYKAPFIGQESLAFANKSVALDADNYMGNVQLGNIAFYTPSLFGGSKKEAIKHYIKALETVEKYPDFISSNWNYLNLLATIINAYYDIEDYEKAEDYCQKTLAIEPEFDWVKNQLYPKIKKALNDE